MLEQIEEKWREKVTVDRQCLVLFTRQLAIMLGTGVPITRALETLSVQHEHPNFEAVIGDILTNVSSGHSLSAAAHRFPRVFPKVYVTMLAIGERTGHMDDSLGRLASWLEEDLGTYQKVKSTLTYPAVVLGLTAVLTGFLFYSLLPGFVGIFEEMGTELPLITKVVLSITKSLQSPGMWAIGIALTVEGVYLFRQYIRTTRGAENFTRQCLGIPLLGSLLKLASNARFCAGMSALLNAGQDLPKSLVLAAEASQNPLMARDARSLSEGLMEGLPLSEQMMEMGDSFPSVLRQMVSAGEEAANMAVMFERAGSYFKSEVDYKLEALSAALEPLLLMLVGSVVGTIIISIFIPLYGTLNQL